MCRQNVQVLDIFFRAIHCTACSLEMSWRGASCRLRRFVVGLVVQILFCVMAAAGVDPFASSGGRD